MPIELLSNIANTFSLTDAEAGIMITAYSWAVMILSLPLMILISKISYMPVLLITLTVFAIGQIASGVTPTFFFLVIVRLIVASAHAVFWSIASVIAVNLVDEQYRDFAMSMIVTGTSVAMIFGLPLGRIVGLYVGWRMTLILAGIIAIVLGVISVCRFPRIKQTRSF